MNKEQFFSPFFFSLVHLLFIYEVTGICMCWHLQAQLDIVTLSK